MAYHSLLRKVITLQRKTKLIPPNSAILVAFSGGIDSSSLAVALQRLKEPLKIKRLALLHINHLLRGEESYRDEKGLEGLLGFEPVEGNIIRPFYLATRQEIEDFAKKQAIEWVEDSTNYDLSLARNRIRHRVVPELKAINPNLEESVLRMREILKEENELLEKLVQTALLKVREEGREGFLKLEQALQRRVVMKLYGVKNFKEVSKIINRIKKGDKI
jgi:tRNA(Ile)-lysidine synthase TilS/MesJ